MKKIFVSVFLVLMAVFVNAQGITGHWGGTLNIQGIELRVIFHISRSSDSLVTTMDSPTQGVKGISGKNGIHG